MLPVGIVCDTCNNYFAREVEKPFLDSPAVTQLRFNEAIPNKRGRIPVVSGLLMPGFPVTARRHLDGPYVMSVDATPEAFAYLENSSGGSLVIPATAKPPDDRVVSRFLAKMALESMAYRVFSTAGGIDYITDEPQLDPIRNFARRGHPQEWPHHARRIYEPHRAVTDTKGNAVQTVHEFDFLVTPANEWYFVFALFGLELTINIGGPTVEGYASWLQAHEGISPLYHGKNASEQGD